MPAGSSQPISDRVRSCLAQANGTVELKLDFHQRPQLPLRGGPTVLLDAAAGETLNRLELDGMGTLRFVRGVRGGRVLSASVHATGLLDAPAWRVYMTFTPDRLELHAGDCSNHAGLLSSAR